MKSGNVMKALLYEGDGTSISMDLPCFMPVVHVPLAMSPSRWFTAELLDHPIVKVKTFKFNGFIDWVAIYDIVPDPELVSGE